MKDINEILVDFNHSVTGSYDKNQQVIEDIRFAKIPGAQWYGSDADQYRNKPKPENNKIARQINRILGQYMRLEMNAKIISASEEATDEDAEMLQSRWRNDFNISDGIEGTQNAADEAFHGGFGAFKLVASYEDEESPNEDYQSLNITPVYSAASSVVFNAGAYRKDKRDAKQGWHLVRVNRSETEEEYGVSLAPFPEATTNYNYFDWTCDNTKDIYIAHYYEVIKKKITEFDFNGLKIIKDGRTYKDEFGNKYDKEMIDDLKEGVEFEKKTKTIQYVEYALISGDQFLIEPRRTPFRTVPIIPQYGYHQVINGIEFYCGEVCRQRDNQRFLNMGFGAMMEIMAQPQVEVPEYLPEQVQRFASMHANRIVENYPYMMSDPVKDKSGNITHMGPVGTHTPPQIGTGMQAAMQYLNQNLDEQGGTGQSTLPSNTSAAAVQQLNDRQDDSYQPMFQNAMQSLKAACEVWISAAQKIYFQNERTLRLESADGSYSQIKTMQYKFDEDRQMIGPFKNSALGKYDVVVKAGEGHKTKKEADKSDNLEILQYTDTATPKGQMVLNNLILSSSAEGTQDARRIARHENIKIMVDMDIDPQPKSDEERQYVEQLMQAKEQAAQNPQPNPQMVLAMAEAQARKDEGQAAIQNEVNDAEKNRIELLKLQLRDKELNIKAAEVGVKVENIRMDTMEKQANIRGKNIDNVTKMIQPFQTAQ